jgi:hypothetical protein
MGLLFAAAVCAFLAGLAFATARTSDPHRGRRCHRYPGVRSGSDFRLSAEGGRYGRRLQVQVLSRHRRCSRAPREDARRAANHTRRVRRSRSAQASAGCRHVCDCAGRPTGNAASSSPRAASSRGFEPRWSAIAPLAAIAGSLGVQCELHAERGRNCGREYLLRLPYSPRIRHAEYDDVRSRTSSPSSGITCFRLATSYCGGSQSSSNRAQVDSPPRRRVEGRGELLREAGRSRPRSRP